MKTNERFLQAMAYMNATMQNDNKLGHQWKYCNTKSKKVTGFEEKRKAGKYLTNCVDGVQDALIMAGIPTNQNVLAWYGGDGKIVWTNKNAEAAVRKYFEIVPTGGKTVKWLYDNFKLCDGDILLGYQGMSHTNCYFGGTQSFDSGHAFCTPKSGEGAKFKKWIGGLTYKNKKVNYILRLIDRAQYRVQAGAFSDINKYYEQAAIVQRKGFPVAMVQEDGMYKVQVGLYSGKTNADRKVALLKSKGIAAFVKEV